MSSPASVGRHFISWQYPLLPQAVDFLAGAWPGDRPLDLARLLVVVPTRQAGRRLREALAEHASARGQAVFAPRVITPESLIGAEAGSEVASRLVSLLAWTKVFRAIDLGAYRAVFPVDPPARNFGWALRLAQEFSGLQASLAENGLTMADVVRIGGKEFQETERWLQLGELERSQARILAGLGLVDGQAAKIMAAQNPATPAGIERIVLLTVPDPLPLALKVLEAYAQRLPVDIVVFAQAAEAAAFDAWGRPFAEVWSQKVIEFPEFEHTVHLCPDPGAQAERITAVARGYGASAGVLGLGVADPEVLPLLEAGLRRAGLAGFNPEGHSRRGDGLYQLLAGLAGLVREDSFAAVESLARCPDFLEFLRTRGGGVFSAARFLETLDELHAQHLPPDLAEARRHAPDSAELAAIAELRAVLTTGTFPENATNALAMVYAGRRFELARATDAHAVEAIEAWTEVMHATKPAGAKFAEVTDLDWWGLALQFYGESRRTDEKPAGAVELQGWLELLWEDAPHLVVSGLNDGSVPDSVVGDPFLPESLRGRLGLKTNAARFARDAYLLQAMIASRAAAGRLDLLLGKTSVAGDPLRPSRLLLRCADAELPRRVGFLFGPAPVVRENPPWRRAWQLQPPCAAPPARVAVTALRAWLDCPLRFYFSRVLGMAAVDPAKTELDALDFGTLCHAALEAMGREPALRDCTDALVLREFLLATLATAATERFGHRPRLPLLVQLESARQRLSRAAEVQARNRAAGWMIADVERKFLLEVGGLTVSGKIDRIDRHEHSGAIRVLDYKSSDQPAQPVTAHLRAGRRDETVPDFARFSAGDRELVWRDLQLPLYLRAMAAEFPGEAGCGYFNLPKAALATGIVLWEGFTTETAVAAWRCAEGVAAAIRQGEFWPPNESGRTAQDEFAALFHHGTAGSVAWKKATA
jgi:ATP-dependent helicase/nuclease subunit B